MSDLRDRVQVQLGDAYRLERELSGGGMSHVFLGTETALGRAVVLKLLPPEVAVGVSLDRFRREMQVVARLQHPHIVPLLTTGTADGVPFYTMPFVDGESLRDRLRRGDVPVEEAVRILRELADALAYAHAARIVHRDIKPENILLAGGHAFITDFGVAKAISAAASDNGTLTLHGIALGTAAYMAPEQGAGDPMVDHRVDLYALGVVGYEMLAGEPPFVGRTAQQLIAAHITETPRPLAERRPDLPHWIATLVDRCMAKQPDNRPQTASVVVGIIDAGGGVARPTAEPAASRALPSRPRISRRTLVVAVMAAVVVAAAVVLRTRSRSTKWTPSDPQAIAVFPFRVTAADPTLQSLREGMLDLIAAKLTGTTHASDPRTVLSAWHRQGGGPSTDLSNDAAAKAARTIGAGRLLQGDIVATPGGMIITGRLSRAGDGSVLVRSSVSGAPAAVALLVDSLVAKLLLLDAGTRQGMADTLAAIPLPALQQYLAATAAYRQGRFADASKAAKLALDIDSSFALAALRHWLAAGWVGEGTPALADRYRLKLGPRDRLLVDAFVPDSEGRPKSCADRIAFYERATAEAPDQPELWYELADLFFHCGDAVGVPDASRRALAGFNRATALDSTFSPALEHMGVLLATLGDSGGSARAFATAEAGRAERIQVDRYSVADSGARARLIPGMLRGSPRSLLAATIAAMTRGVGVNEAEQFVDAARKAAITERERSAVAAVELQLALNRGQPQRAAAAAIAMRRTPANNVLDALFWDGDSLSGATALRVVRKAFERSPPAGGDSLNVWVDAVYAAAQYDLSNREQGTARRAISLLRSVTVKEGPRWFVDRPRHLAQLLEAQVAVLERRSDARAIAAATDSMLRVSVERDAPWITRVGNLAIARVWESIGDPLQAYAATKRYVPGTSAVGNLSTYARERARLAAVVGDREGAIAAYRLYLGLRYDPDPSLRNEAAAARRAFDRLLAGSGGR